MIRKIIEIDEERCDGCGMCAEACAEGAIQIVDGVAKLVSDSYCDGLGACIGECPRDAIAIIEREAEEFDEVAVERHLAGARARGHGEERGSVEATDTLACGCPGSMTRELSPGVGVCSQTGETEAARTPSRLRNWPVQLHLVPVNAPYLRGASLLLAADCTGFALADFHRLLLDGKVLLVACPKLDDADFYREKLTAILRENSVKDLTVAFMEVPCCFGLVNLARQAIADSGKDVSFSSIKLGIEGDVVEVEEGPSRIAM